MNTQRSSTAHIEQAARQKAREEILLQLLREGATSTQLRSELAARCGGAALVDAAKEWLREHKLIRAAGGYAPFELTPLGRDRAEELRERRAQKGRAA